MPSGSCLPDTNIRRYRLHFSTAIGLSFSAFRNRWKFSFFLAPFPVGGYKSRGSSLSLSPANSTRISSLARSDERGFYFYCNVSKPCSFRFRIRSLSHSQLNLPPSRYITTRLFHRAAPLHGKTDIVPLSLGSTSSSIILFHHLIACVTSFEILDSLLRFPRHSRGLSNGSGFNPRRTVGLGRFP